MHLDQNRIQYGIFLPHQETLLSLLPHKFLSLSVYSLFFLCSHTTGFRSKYEISMVGTQTARAFMFLTSCPCVCCLFSSSAILTCWSHDVVHPDCLAHILWSWRFADMCCGGSARKSWNCINTKVLIHQLMVQISNIKILNCYIKYHKMRDDPQCFFDSTQFLNNTRPEVCLTSLLVLVLKQAMGDVCWTQSLCVFIYCTFISLVHILLACH